MRTTLVLAAFAVVIGGTVAVIRPFALTSKGRLNYEGQWLKPAGPSIPLNAKTTSMCAVGDAYVAVRTNSGIALFDADTGGLIRKFNVPGGAGLTGIVSNGTTIWVSGSEDAVTEVDLHGKVLRTLKMPKPNIGGDAYPAGLCLTKSRNSLLVCSNRGNEVVEFNLGTNNIRNRYHISPAPYEVIEYSPGGIAVTCWAKKPVPADRTTLSSGTPVPTTETGMGKGGTIDYVDLEGENVYHWDVGLQPTHMAQGVISDEAAARMLKEKPSYSAHKEDFPLVGMATISNSDQLYVQLFWEKKTIQLPQMSIPDSVSFDIANRRYYVACMGSNIVRVYDEAATYLGCIHTSGSPTGVLAKNGKLWVSTSKGLGPQVTPRKAYSSYNYSGDVMVVPTPTLAQLQAGEKNQPGVIASPTQFPFKKGAIEHVVYILKENRTYDQVFGDMKQGDGEPKLCTFGQKVTPNQHALAEQFGLLDNYYCNGVLSADGHSWAMEGSATTYLERGFGGWSRSYPYGGDDALAVSYTGYIWDPVLKAGKTFRNFGEFDTATLPKDTTWKMVYDDWKSGANKIKVGHSWGTSQIDKYSDPNASGWNLDIPDVIRAEVFLKAFRGYETKGAMPNFTIIYLPQDHTAGVGVKVPHPEAMVADNDLAVGQIVDAISHSKFWGKTAIFINEDDPQAGTDHIDGHRSTCLVVSPYSKRGATVSDFYCQNSVNRTILALLGLPPLHARMAQAPLMANCFTAKPDLTPFALRPNQIPIDWMNEAKPATKALMQQTATLDFSKPDKADEQLLNRIIWASVQGPNVPYPAHMAGSHGRGLAQKGLQLDGSGTDIDEDDD